MLGVLGLTISSRWLVPDPAGLQVEVFASPDVSGTAVRSIRTSEVSMRSTVAAWILPPPEIFSARWTGYLVVTESGNYTFSLTSDDGSRLRIADEVVVDNGGEHAAQTKTGQRALERGTYPLVVEYTQAGGSAALELLWARDGAQPALVPRWAFSRHPVSPAIVTALQWHERLFVPSLAALGLLLVWIMFPATPD